jgi:hypothetical protein
MTGRKAGFCGGFGVPGSASQGAGRGFGRGRAGGRGGHGRRNMFYATGLTGWQRAAAAAESAKPVAVAPEAIAEKQILETEIEAMQSQLDAMKQRLAEIEVPRT